MNKIIKFLVLILGGGIFTALIYASSPYRELRLYEIFGKKIPENIGMQVKTINGTQAILIEEAEKTEPFYIDQIPVTIGMYKNCIDIGNCEFQHYRYNYTRFWNSDIYNIFPITFVNWFDAQNYCHAYGGELPTAAQWELAAGSAYHSDYPWGNALPSLSTANLDGYYQWLTPAGWLPKGASPYGVLDMTGNVREWVLDEIYEDNDNKLLKGGCNSDSFMDGKINAYFDHGPTSSGFNRGFRCVYPVD